MNFLGVLEESLNDSNAKKKAKEENQGRHSNVQRIQMVGDQQVASRQYPTIYAALSPTNK